MQVIDFLGKGWKFPVSVSKERICKVEAENSIRESIILILSTAKGERIMHPEFGCRLNEILFDHNNTSSATLIRIFVEEALLVWEPRVEVLDVQVTPHTDEPVMDIFIEYLVKSVNSKENLVYPFYLESVGR